MIVPTMPPICSDCADRSSIARPDRRGRGSRHGRGWRSVADSAAADALAAATSRAPRSAAPAGRDAVSRARRTAAVLASWTATRVDSTMRTWRSAPWATSVTACGDLADGAAGLVGGGGHLLGGGR